MRGQQGLTVPHSEMVAVQKDIASNLAWRREGRRWFVFVCWFFFWGGGSGILLLFLCSIICWLVRSLVRLPFLNPAYIFGRSTKA